MWSHFNIWVLRPLLVYLACGLSHASEPVRVEAQFSEILAALNKLEPRDSHRRIATLEKELLALPKDTAGNRKRIDIYFEIADLCHLRRQDQEFSRTAHALAALTKKSGSADEAMIGQAYVILSDMVMAAKSEAELQTAMEVILDWMEKNGSERDKGIFYRLYALLHANLGQVPVANYYLNRAESIASSLNNRTELARIKRDKAFAAGVNDDTRGVLNAYIEMLQLMPQTALAIDGTEILYNVSFVVGSSGYSNLAKQGWQTARAYVSRNNIAQYRFLIPYAEALQAAASLEDGLAIASSQEALRFISDSPSREFPLRWRLAVSLARTGQVAEAETQLARIKHIVETSSVPARYADDLPEIDHIEALLQAARGDSDGAILALERAREKMIVAKSLSEWEAQEQLAHTVGTFQAKESRRLAELEISRQERLLAIAAVVISGFIIMVVALLMLNRKVREASAQKMQLLVNVSHEVRTPLNGIMGALALADQSSAPDERKDLIRIARNSAQILLTVVNDVLEFASLERNSVKLRPEPANLRALVYQAADLMTPGAKQKHLDMVVEYPHDLDLWVIVDETRLQQILYNLLHNSIKFTDHGTITFRVMVGAENDGTVPLTFEISDTGIGMDQSELTRIFERFHQANRGGCDNRGGTGIGLAIVKQLTELMGGTVEVESSAGKGTTFKINVTLPKAQPAEKKAVSADEIAAQPVRSLKILLAEDNPVNQMLFQRIISAMGHKVDIAANGQEAVDRVEQANVAADSYDVVLMDIMMPVLDGIDATRQIRSIGSIRQPQIIALTANALDEQEKACRAAGMDDFISKPVSPEALAARLGKAASI